MEGTKIKDSLRQALIGERSILGKKRSSMQLMQLVKELDCRLDQGGDRKSYTFKTTGEPRIWDSEEERILFNRISSRMRDALGSTPLPKPLDEILPYTMLEGLQYLAVQVPEIGKQFIFDHHYHIHHQLDEQYFNFNAVGEELVTEIRMFTALGNMVVLLSAEHFKEHVRLRNLSSKQRLLGMIDSIGTKNEIKGSHLHFDFEL